MKIQIAFNYNGFNYHYTVDDEKKKTRLIKMIRHGVLLYFTTMDGLIH